MKPLSEEQHAAPEKKHVVTEVNLARITAAERMASGVIRRDMEPHLAAFRAKGYTRLEIACVFVTPGYHALRYDRSQAQAEESFDLVVPSARSASTGDAGGLRSRPAALSAFVISRSEANIDWSPIGRQPSRNTDHDADLYAGELLGFSRP